jgi:hypothetical protein
VRAKYPPKGASGEAGARGCEPESVPLGPARLPTPHLPGTPGKFSELCRRYETRQELWHPQDAGG